MYKYVDDSGLACMTNSLQSVPKKYRTRMTVVKEESNAPKKLLPEVQITDRDPLPATTVTERRQQQPDTVKTPPGNSSRYMRTALLVGVMAAGYFLLTRVAGAMNAPKVGTLLFLGLVLFCGVYLYGLYINEISSVFGMMRRDALNIKRNVETRDQKSEQLLKQMHDKELVKE
jgi:hypothetical protein